MTRKRWIQHPVTLELVPADQYERPDTGAPMIMGDIQPYKSMITGEIIQGRRQHREHLRQHGCIEVGNEKLTPKKPTNYSREDYRRSVADVMSGKGY